MKNKKNHKKIVFVMAVALSLLLFSANISTAFATDTMNNASSDAMVVTDDSPTSDGSITPRSDAGSYITKTLV